MHNMVHMRVCMHMCGARVWGSGGRGLEGECVWRCVCGGACVWWGVLVVGHVCVGVGGGGTGRDMVGGGGSLHSCKQQMRGE